MVSGSRSQGRQLRERYPAFDVLWRYRVPVLVGLASLAGLIVASRARAFVLFDDAAITMRYASRLADGHGWTYNDGDRTSGASAPLYTMILAFMDLVGFNVVTAARIVCSVSFAASLGLVAFLGSRIAGFVAGVLASGFLFFWVDFQTQALGGMESALAVALGLAVVVALREDRDTWAGVLLGLALVNKLDAGLLAAAVAIAYLIVLRRPPWRVAAIGAAILAPWLIFATVYFGSPLPHSLTQKTSGTVVNPSTDFTPMWMIDQLRQQQVILVAVIALAAIAVLPRLIKDVPRAALALGVCLAWPILHLLAFSLIDLGDRYSWYMTALYAPVSVAAACALAFAIKSAAPRSRPVVVALVVAVAVVAVGLPNERFGQVGFVSEALREGHTPIESEWLDRVRQEAGRYVDEVAEPGDVVETCFGWIAFEAEDATIDETCPLNTRDDVGPPRWGVYITHPGTTAPEVPDGSTVVESFISEEGLGTRIDVVEFETPTD